MHVRLLTAVEMVINRPLYDVNAPGYGGQLNPATVFTGPYNDVITSVTTDGGYAELIHLYGISGALGNGI